MSRNYLLSFSTLEKLKAGLGAAGIAAVGVEALGPRLLGGLFTGVLGGLLPIVAGVMSAVAASYFTVVSGKEEELESEAAREGTMKNAIDG